MIFQALHELARNEDLVQDPDYEFKPVAWLIKVSKDGKLLSVEGTHQVPNREMSKKRPRQVAMEYRVPREKALTSGDRAFLLFGKSEYVLGRDAKLDKDRKRPAEKLALRFDLFRQKIRQCLDATDDEGVRAVYMALEDVATGKQSAPFPPNVESNDLFAFVYAPDVNTLVFDRPKVREYWKCLRRRLLSDGGMQRQCLVTGSLFSEEPENFPPLQHMPGGRSSGVALVSFNSRAFESYGWKGNENAAVCRDASEACATALNRLLRSAFPNPKNPILTLPSRHVRISGDTVVCFWSACKNDFIDEFAQLFLTNQRGHIAHKSIWETHVDDPTVFYALTLTGTQGRAIVRGWLESSVAQVVKNLQAHFGDLEIVRNTPKSKGKDLAPVVPLPILLDSLTPIGKSKDVPGALAELLVRCALRGEPYPISVLSRALERTRAEIGNSKWVDMERRDARAALIKAVLKRKHRAIEGSTQLEVKRAMDPNNMNEGYLLGRLIAVIEKLHSTALGTDNASVVGRCFSAASASPRSVFIRLLKSARHHVGKAKSDSQTAGTARWLDRQIDELADRFDPKNNGFPSYLDQEQQGMFVLGYHQQRHWLWMSKEDREAWAIKNGLNAERAS